MDDDNGAANDDGLAKWNSARIGAIEIALTELMAAIALARFPEAPHDALNADRDRCLGRLTTETKRAAVSRLWSMAAKRLPSPGYPRKPE